MIEGQPYGAGFVCIGKKKYQYRTEAVLFKRKHKLDEMEIYQCGFCSMYHLGHIRRQLVKERLKAGMIEGGK